MNTKEQIINKMVDRFLGWKLPADFAPDAGITFKPNANPDSPIEYQYKHEPTGTNLFHAGQAEAMFKHVAKPLLDHITELEAQLADAKQIANDCRIVADNAIAEALGAKKDAARWQAVKPMFRTMSANIDGNHTWTLAYHGSLKGASMDDAADAFYTSLT